MKVEINQTFLPIKALYFLYLSGMACLNPYLPVYMVALGLSEFQTGLIRGLEPAVQLLVSPMCGLFSDKYSCHKIVLILAVIGSAVFYFLTIFVPPVSVFYANITTAGNVLFQSCNQDFSNEPMNKSLDGVFAIGNYTTFNKSSVECDCEKFQYLPFEALLNDSAVLNTSMFAKNMSCLNFTDYDCSMINCLCFCCKLNHSFINSSAICNAQDMITSTATFGSSTLTFVLMLTLILTGQMFICNVFPLVDMAVVELLQDNRGDYGRQRLWGAVGWGTFAALMGVIIDQNHTTSIKAKYLPAHLSFLILVLVAVIATVKMTFPPHRRPSFGVKKVYNVLCQAEIIMFLIILVVMGMCMGIIQTFLFIYIADLDGDHLIMGLTLTITCLSEIPFLYFSGRLIDICGHQNVIYMTLFCYCLRFLGYALVQNPWLVLIVEPLHGITYGALWAALKTYASIISPPGMAATLQSFVSTVKMGLGKGIGTIVGGLVYHQFGGRFLFRCCAILCLVTAVIYFLSRQLITRTCPINDYRLFHDEEDVAVEQQLEDLQPSPESLPVKIKSRKSMRLVLQSINRPADCPLDDGSNMTKLLQGVSPVLPSHGPSGASVCVQTQSSQGQSTESSSCSSFVDSWPFLPTLGPTLGEEEEEFQSKMSVVNVDSYMPSPNVKHRAVINEHTV